MNPQYVTHVSCACYKCTADLASRDTLEAAMRKALAGTGAKVLGAACQSYAPCGLTCVLFLAESHLAVTTWPEFSLAIVDVQLCNDRMDPVPVVTRLAELLGSTSRTVNRFAHRIAQDADEPADACGGATPKEQGTR